MTTATDIADLLERRQAFVEAYRDIKDGLNEIDYQIIAYMRETYPEDWQRWERGVQSFKAEGVEIPLTRSYDTDKLQAEFGEEMPDVVTSETKVVTKANGRKLASMWKDAGLARRLESCVVPSTPKVKVSD